MSKNTSPPKQSKLRERIIKLWSLLEKHDLLYHAKEIANLENMRNNTVFSNKVDLKEQDKQLNKLYKKIDLKTKSYFKKQDQVVKVASISWLSSICDIDEFPEAAEWAFLTRSKTDKEFEVVNGGYSNDYCLNDRLNLAFENYPKETLEAVSFAAYVQNILFRPHSIYMSPARIRSHLIFSSRYKSTENNHTPNMDLKYLEILIQLITKKDPKSSDIIIEQFILIDHYLSLDDEGKENLIGNIKKLIEIAKLDHKKLLKYKNNQAFLDSAEHYLEPSKKFKKSIDIAEKIDSYLRFNLDSLQQRKTIYSKIEQIYRNSVAPSQNCTPQTFTLTNEELNMLTFLKKETGSSQITVLRESIKHAQDKYKKHKKNEFVRECITAKRAGTKKKTFKLNSADLEVIEQLSKSISLAGLELPRTSNKSLAIGIAIRLYAESKRHRPCAYTGERVGPISATYPDDQGAEFYHVPASDQLEHDSTPNTNQSQPSLGQIDTDTNDYTKTVDATQIPLRKNVLASPRRSGRPEREQSADSGWNVIASQPCED